MNKQNASDYRYLPEAPEIPGLAFRGFRGAADLARMVDILNDSRAADQIDEVDDLTSLSDRFAHLVNCDPDLDILIIELDGIPIGYGRVFWQEVWDGGRLYNHEGFLIPAWRGKGIGWGLLCHNEHRLREIAAAHQNERTPYFEVEAAGTETAKIRLLERAGYRPARYFAEMVRPDLEAIPDYPIPTGLELRPAREEDYRTIWEANIDAMRDHWEHVDYTEEDYEYWVGGDLDFQPELWQVAWDIELNQVAGMVLPYILDAQNERYNRLRGWPEDICVRRPYRKRGLARALIAASLRALKARGMTEAALTADTENLSGAFRLYESLRFKVEKLLTVYRKPVEGLPE